MWTSSSVLRAESIRSHWYSWLYSWSLPPSTLRNRRAKCRHSHIWVLGNHLRRRHKHRLMSNATGSRVSTVSEPIATFNPISCVRRPSLRRVVDGFTARVTRRSHRRSARRIDQWRRVRQSVRYLLIQSCRSRKSCRFARGWFHRLGWCRRVSKVISDWSCLSIDCHRRCSGYCIGVRCWSTFRGGRRWPWRGTRARLVGDSSVRWFGVWVDSRKQGILRIAYLFRVYVAVSQLKTNRLLCSKR